MNFNKITLLMNIAVYTITSELHDEKAVASVTQYFLDSLHIDFEFRGNDFSDFGQKPLNLIYVRTGGTEGIFKQLLPDLLKRYSRPFYLLTSGKSNSLAASLEILSFLRQQGLKGEVLHGTPDYISRRVDVLLQTEEAMKVLYGSRLGIIGEPSDWLISSGISPVEIRRQLGIQLVRIPMKELQKVLDDIPETTTDEVTDRDDIRQSLPGAHRIYLALKLIVEKYNLQGFTLRCFDLLKSVRNTGCLALARLNAEGIVAGCEGDIPALLSMSISHALTGYSGFQANPAYINVEQGEMLFAHCTIPLNMVERYELDTHFESGIGVGIRGYMKEGPVTIFKVSGDLSRHYASEGELVRNQAQEDLCRTQQIIRLSNPEDASYFLKNPIGNHHIIIPGHFKQVLDECLGK